MNMPNMIIRVRYTENTNVPEAHVSESSLRFFVLDIFFGEERFFFAFSRDFPHVGPGEAFFVENC